VRFLPFSFSFLAVGEGGRFLLAIRLDLRCGGKLWDGGIAGLVRCEEKKTRRGMTYSGSWIVATFWASFRLRLPCVVDFSVLLLDTS
jgi:hypothetical protein